MQLTKDTVGATHALACGVPDRGSNEVRFLQEALDMLEDFQRQTRNHLGGASKTSSPAEDEVGSMRKFTVELEEDDATKYI